MVNKKQVNKGILFLLGMIFLVLSIVNASPFCRDLYFNTTGTRVNEPVDINFTINSTDYVYFWAIFNGNNSTIYSLNYTNSIYDMEIYNQPCYQGGSNISFEPIYNTTALSNADKIFVYYEFGYGRTDETLLNTAGWLGEGCDTATATYSNNKSHRGDMSLRTEDFAEAGIGCYRDFPDGSTNNYFLGVFYDDMVSLPSYAERRFILYNQGVSYTSQGLLQQIDASNYMYSEGGTAYVYSLSARYNNWIPFKIYTNSTGAYSWVRNSTGDLIQGLNGYNLVEIDRIAFSNYKIENYFDDIMLTPYDLNLYSTNTQYFSPLISPELLFIDLVFPTSNYTSNITLITFNCSATNTELLNLTLVIDGNDNITVFNLTSNQSKLSILQSYNFADGIYTWGCIGYSQTVSNSSYRSFTIDIKIYPTIILNSPIDYYNTSNKTIIFNCSAFNDQSIINLTLFINGIENLTIYNSTAYQNLSLNTELNLSDGNYNWSCLTYDNKYLGTQSSTRYFYINTTYIPPIPPIPQPSETIIYNILSGTGAGLGLFLQFIAIALPYLIFPLIFVGIIIVISFAIANKIKNIRMK